jgi:hypothetical protein
MRRELAMFHEVILDIDESPGRLTKRGEPLVASAHVDRAAVYGDSLAADSLYRSRSPVVSGGIRWYPVVSGGLGTRFGGRVSTVTGGHAVVHHETP